MKASCQMPPPPCPHLESEILDCGPEIGSTQYACSEQEDHWLKGVHLLNERFPFIYLNGMSARKLMFCNFLQRHLFI